MVMVAASSCQTKWAGAHAFHYSMCCSHAALSTFAGESAYYEAEHGAEVVKFGRKYIIPKVRGAAGAGTVPVCC